MLRDRMSEKACGKTTSKKLFLQLLHFQKIDIHDTIFDHI